MINDNLQRTLIARTAPGWRPQQGDVITGSIVSMGRAESEYGFYPRIVLERTDSQAGDFVAVHAFHATLKQGLADLHAEGALNPGDVITIAYAGRHTSNKQTGADGKPREYELYTVLAGDGTDAPAADAPDLFA